MPLLRRSLDHDDIVSRFHNAWEFWAYNVVFGLFQAPYYAFSQTMMAELSPPGFDNMVRPAEPSSSCGGPNKWGNFQFFGLFGLSNRASSMIGPNVIQAIINKSGNNWDGFPFLYLREPRYLVLCRRVERATRRRQVGCETPWDGGLSFKH